MSNCICGHIYSFCSRAATLKRPQLSTPENSHGFFKQCRYFLGLWCALFVWFNTTGMKVRHGSPTENCRPPSSMSGYFIADRIRRIARPFGAITLFNAYLELNSEFLSARPYVLQSELQSSGISLTHCPHNGRKDVADKMMIGALMQCVLSLHN